MNAIESLAKPENAAAVWSAVAASFSALAAYLSWRAQVRALHHNFRPEVVVTGWHRRPATDHVPESLCFSIIKNTGRDTARQIIVNASGEADDGRITYVAGTVNVASLAPNEQSTVDGRILLRWGPVQKRGTFGKMLPVAIKVWSWDPLDVRHVTKISLLVMEDPNSQMASAVNVAPGVYLMSQSTRSVPVWKVKLRRNMKRVPLLRRMIDDDA